MPDHIAPLNPPTRLLCGPGPVQRPPAGARGDASADARPPRPRTSTKLLEQLVELLEARLPARGRAHAGAVRQRHLRHGGGLASLTEPGDTVIVAVAGFFGARIVEIARRHGANVVEVAVELGQAVPNELILEALDRASRDQAGRGGSRRDLDRRAAPAERAGGGHARLAGAADGRLRDLARRHRAGRRRLGPRLLLLVQPEVPRARRRGCRRYRSRSARSSGSRGARRRCPTASTSSCCASTGSTAPRCTTTRCRSCSTTRCTRRCG